MNATIRHIILVIKSGHEKARALALEIQAWIRARDISTHVVVNKENCDLLGGGQRRPDCVIVLGGDGTMLSVARKVNGHNIPLLGVNLGNVGFLTEACSKTWEQMLVNLLSGKVAVSSRAVLRYTLYRDDEPFCSGKVFNDLVVNRGSLARLVNLAVCFGTECLGHVRADGLIVSTPTGSTGYCVSAGGPLVYPELDAFILTPICPFLNTFAPLVLPFDSPVSITVNPNNAETYLTLDGQQGVCLQTGDRVEIGRAQTGVKLIHAPTSSYIAKLQSKGFVRERP
ncbi:NAD(+)/NADH kinase [Desulfoplanes sp.]